MVIADRSWEPLSIHDVIVTFAQAPFRWWFCGGTALELHIKHSWRVHSDIDIGVCRMDARRLYAWLPGWDLHLAAGGRLTPWDGRPLSADDAENNVWCRRDPSAPWCLDVTIGAGDERRWVYRRDDRIARSWREAVLVSSEGLPYLAPELQLLFKSKHPRSKDDDDAATVITSLTTRRRRTLATLLPRGHPWRGLLPVG